MAPEGVRSTPTDVTSVAATASAVVSWTPPSSSGASPLTGDEVVTYVDGLAEPTPVEVGADVSSVEVDGLEQGHIHTFKVSAVG